MESIFFRILVPVSQRQVSLEVVSREVLRVGSQTSAQIDCSGSGQRFGVHGVPSNVVGEQVVREVC
jgi:hypothetical protein